MDYPYNVPQIVNRHVLRAIKTLSEMDPPNSRMSAIKNEVRWTIRNANPVQDLDTQIVKSVINFLYWGVI
ncbi:hypothetical protein KR018_007357, partial [Drosophila ironensis]